MMLWSSWSRIVSTCLGQLTRPGQATRKGGTMEPRRTFLKRLAALGVAVPCVSAFAGVPLASAGPRGGATQLAREAGLSARQLAGQRVIYSFPGLTVPDTLLRAIGAGEAAGVIFFGDNIASDEQLAALVPQLRPAQGPGAPAPPVLAVAGPEGG